MNPASRNSISQVTNIGITSPLGKAKKESAFPIKGSNRHFANVMAQQEQSSSVCHTYMVLYGHPRCRIYSIIHCEKSQEKQYVKATNPNSEL
jgi:hypothetical protein